MVKLNSVSRTTKGKLVVNYTIPNLSQPIQQIDIVYDINPIVIIGQVTTPTSEQVTSTLVGANTHQSLLLYASGSYVRLRIKVSGFDTYVYSNQIQLT